MRILIETHRGEIKRFNMTRDMPGEAEIFIVDDYTGDYVTTTIDFDLQDDVITAKQFNKELEDLNFQHANGYREKGEE